MVFDSEAAPRDREKFMAWYDQQTKWTEAHGYHDPAATTPRLRAWFEEIARTFPSIDGPLAGHVDDSRITDYSIGRLVIYAAFAWSQADAAYEYVVGLAAKHGVGFFDVSSAQGQVLFPVDGQLVCASSDNRIDAPELLDLVDELAARSRDVGGARLRWFATALAMLSLAISVAMLTDLMSPPDNMNPTIGKILIVSVFVFWSILAISNWWGWIRARLKRGA